ncbi:threonylcarbamoyl-AMP synthase [Candidatus Peregrinibacteria bacterium]|nr:threonylcarbamoyl-AMP synthase [Candidatus Peregrinibacteria bacterium]MBI3816367.1 threonylcarbamoyl-AMP synthase [Candidatus Peregrinibacteria bacterium]
MNILEISEAALMHAMRILQTGGIVAHATETCYGFACDLSNPIAVEKLFALKKRPVTQPVSALFASIENAKRYVEWNEEAERLAKEHLPGPLTLILPLQKNAPPIFPVAVFRSPKSEVRSLNLALRLSSYPVAQELVARFGSPLSTTSANLHGQPSPYSVVEIVQQFEEEELQPDLILDSGPLPIVPPSTILDLTKPDIRTVRKGTL